MDPKKLAQLSPKEKQALARALQPSRPVPPKPAEESAEEKARRSELEGSLLASIKGATLTEDEKAVKEKLTRLGIQTPLQLYRWLVGRGVDSAQLNALFDGALEK